jgi:hypothetical protein
LKGLFGVGRTGVCVGGGGARGELVCVLLLLGYIYATLSRVGQPTGLKIFVKHATEVQSLRCVWGGSGMCAVVYVTTGHTGVVLPG